MQTNHQGQIYRIHLAQRSIKIQFDLLYSKSIKTGNNIARVSLILVHKPSSYSHFSEDAEAALTEYMKYRLDESTVLDTILERGIFNFIHPDCMEKMEKSRQSYMLKDVIDEWLTCKPKTNMIRSDNDKEVFRSVKRVIISLLLQKPNSSDQERHFSLLARADDAKQYFNRTLASVRLKAFAKNKDFFFEFKDYMDQIERKI